MYIEADAWATNLKQKLACGSVLMSAKMEFYEFFTRALQPNVHYVEVSTKDMCQDTASKVLTGPPAPTSVAPWICQETTLGAHHSVLKHLVCTCR